MGIRYRYTCPDRSLVHPGIPPCDLSDEDLAALTAEQRATVEASELYEAVKQEKKSPAVEEAPGEE